MSQPPDRTASHPRQTPPTGRRLSESFKRDAVRLMTHEQYSFQTASHAVGVSGTRLHKWHKKHADPTGPCVEDAPPTLSPDGGAKVTYCRDPEGVIVEWVE